MKLYIITSKDTKKCLQVIYTKSDLKAIVPYKQYCIEHAANAQLDEVSLTTGKLRRVYG